MSDTRSRSKTKTLVYSTEAVLAASIVFMLVVPKVGQTDMGETLGLPLMFFGYIIAGVLFTRGSTSYHGRERLAWALIGSAFLLGAAGVLSFAVAYASGVEIPAFGPLDLCFIPDGFPDGYATLSEHATVIEIAAVDVPVASLEDVVASKRAAGRPKDIVALPPLEARLRRP